MRNRTLAAAGAAIMLAGAGCGSATTPSEESTGAEKAASATASASPPDAPPDADRSIPAVRRLTGGSLEGWRSGLRIARMSPPKAMGR